MTCDGLASHPGGSSNIPSRLMLQNRDKLRPDRPLADFTFCTFTFSFILMVILLVARIIRNAVTEESFKRRFQCRTINIEQSNFDDELWWLTR